MVILDLFLCLEQQPILKFQFTINCYNNQVTCQLEPLEGLEAASLPRLIHIQVVAGEAGEYDIVYSLPKEGRYIFTNFTWDQICVMLDINHSSVIAQEVNSVHFSDTRCGSEFMAVTFKIVLSWSDFITRANSLPVNLFETIATVRWLACLTRRCGEGWGLTRVLCPGQGLQRDGRY